ncbi:MAG TPA: NADH-quinone oxidoreductase subunit M [Chthonomonadaceae bacterium]|nr:NADH-quinone oxidoreductase subunit M [Chthonomonadaceae bacterium]
MQSPIPGILSILTFLPLVGALIVMFLPRPKDLPEEHGHEAHGVPDTHAPPPAVDPARQLVNWVTLAVVLVDFVLSLVLFASFSGSYVQPTTRNMQFLEDARWITAGNLNIHYRMGVDGISLLLIVLTTFLMVLCVLYSFGVKQRLKEFMVFMLLLETGMIGVFCALDLVLFYFFWEAMLIPMYFLIGIFGHENRIYAAIKFFLYTFAGSILMLIAIIAVYHLTGSLDVIALSVHGAGPGAALSRVDPRTLMWIYAAFALAFMIKVPMFPFHTWLPDAHVEAPTAGSVLLAGVLLKMGTYGFIRFCVPMFPAQALASSNLFILLAIVGIIYGSIVAAVQPDAKKLVAYSSVAHLGFVILGIFTFTRIGLMGALLQNLAHGIATPMLFFVVGMLYERRHTRLISEFGGIKRIVPMLATMLLLAVLASIAVPFFSGFVGEFPVMMGSWLSMRTGYVPTLLAGTGMILSAVYMLWWFQRLMLGPVTRPANRHLPDMTVNEWFVLTPLAVMIFWLGLGSSFWTQRMDSAVNAMIAPVGGNTDFASVPEQMDPDLSVTVPLRAQRVRRRAPAAPPAPGQTPTGGGRPPTVPPAGARNAQEPASPPRRLAASRPAHSAPTEVAAPHG